jgi:hypothetical protein
MEEHLTHWKKLRNLDYLGSHDFDDITKEYILTIAKVEQKMVANPSKDGALQPCTVVTWVEKFKPMICNATNAKAIQKVAKTPYIEKWAGTKVQIYVAKVKAFGEIHDAIRVRSTAPSGQVQQLNFNPSDFIFQIELIEDLKSLADYYLNLDPEVKAHPEIIAAKDKRKTELS